MTVQIIILAMVAAFLGMRLYSVLGKRTGHEQEPLPHTVEREADAMRPQPVPAQRPGDDGVIDLRPGQSLFYEPAAENGIRKIMAADRNFDVARFIGGAKSAYQMVLEAYWTGDHADLQMLCDADVYGDFAEAISAREARGETLDNRLVRIDAAKIINAEYNAPTARISLRFDADIASVVRNSGGEHIAGSLSDAVETHEMWSFARDLNSPDPNWKLVATDDV